MGRYEVIRERIDSLNGGQFQTLAQHYVTALYGYRRPHYLGTKAGTQETTIGVPDTFWPIGEGRYVFVECGHRASSKCDAEKKIRDDINSCLDCESDSDGTIVVERIIICYGYGRFEPVEVAKLELIDNRVELIGPDQIAEGLYRDFPGLAKDYLGLDIDSNQILEPDAFIRQIEKDGFAPSLLGPLIGRDEELGLLQEDIEANRAVVVLGKSGCGKTKLAFEACKAYAERSGVTFFVIRSRHRSVYEDLRTYLGPGKGYLILVDDANDMKDMADLVDYALDHDNVKLVLTVRNYAADSVSKIIGRLKDHKRYELSLLGREETMRIASDLLKKCNDAVVGHVVESSRGNLRLMHLAAQSVSDQGITSIRNMKHLLDLCYGNKLDLLSENERKASGVSSILGPHKTEGNEELEALEQLAGIGHGDYKIACAALCEMELLDSLHGIAAVSFEEQNIRDYLIYDAVCVTRWVTLADIDAFSQGDYRLKHVLNILLEVFGDDDTAGEARRQLNAIWDCADAGRKWKLAQEFGPVFGHRALLMAVERMDNRPKIDYFWTEDCFRRHAKSHACDCGELAVLESFLGTDLTDSVVDALLQFIERRIVSASDSRRCFYELGGAVKIARRGYDFASVEALVIKLRTWCADDPDRVFCFLSFTEGVMDEQKMHMGRSLDDRNALVQKSVISGDEMLRLRQICVVTIRGWQGIARVHQPSLDILLGYKPGWAGSTFWGVSARTVSMLMEEFVPYFIPESVCDYERLLQFERVAKRCGCAVDIVGGLSARDRASEILVSLLKCDFDLDSRDRAVKELGVALQVCEYVDLFGLLRQLNVRPHDSWWVTYSTKAMMLALRDADPTRFGRVCLSYLESGACADVAGPVVSDYAVKEFGAIGARDWCLAHAANSHPVWLHLCNVAAIATGGADEVVECILAEFDQVNRPLYFDDIYKCEMRSRGFMPRYFEKVFEWDEREGRFPNWTLPYGRRIEGLDLCGFADRPESVTVLEKAYLWSLEREPEHFDGDSALWLVEIDPPFAMRLVSVATAAGAEEVAGSVGKAIRGVSPQADLFGDVVRAIYETDDRFVYCGRQSSLLRFVNGAMDDSNREAIVRWMAEKAVCEDDFGMFVLGVARALDGETKKLFVLEACRRGIGIREFSEACCGMSFLGESWSGSYVPLLRRKTAFLSDLENELADFGSSAYRLELARLKEQIEQWIYEVEEDEFVMR